MGSPPLIRLHGPGPSSAGHPGAGKRELGADRESGFVFDKLAGGAASNEVSLERYVAVIERLAVDQFFQHVEGALGDPVDRHGHGRQRRRDLLGDLDVVEADDAEIVGNFHA